MLTFKNSKLCKTEQYNLQIIQLMPNKLKRMDAYQINDIWLI